MIRAVKKKNARYTKNSKLDDLIKELNVKPTIKELI